MLITEATRGLPDSYLFCQAAHRADLLDETGLDIWDSGPPYPDGPPSDSPRELMHTTRLVEVMHGRNARRLCEIGEGVGEDVEQLLNNLLEEWRIANIFMESYEAGHREVTMASLWKEWVARQAYHYFEKLNSCI